jgi:hypothetical protein
MKKRVNRHPSKSTADEDLEKQIGKLREQLQALSPDGVVFGTSENLSVEAEKAFLERVVAWEQAPSVTPFDLLRNSGITLQPEQELSDALIHTRLWEIIEALALLGLHLHNTDHLSDRELYRFLWAEVLPEPTELLPEGSGFLTHWDCIGSGSEEDLRLYLEFYADESERRQWAQDDPGLELPAPKARPYDRDRHLPASRPEWSRGHA